MTQKWIDEGPAADADADTEDEDDDSVEVYFEIPKAPCQSRSTTGNDDFAVSAAVTSWRVLVLGVAKAIPVQNNSFEFFSLNTGYRAGLFR